LFAVNDALDAIYLGCFFFGLLFSVGSIVIGVVDIGADTDFDVDSDSNGLLGLINVSTVLAFLAWFGGFGYLARNGLGTIAVVSLVIALAGGIAGAAAVGWVLRKLKQSEQVLDPSDYQLPGTLAQVTSGIRVGGVGEIIYEQAGVRQVSAARSIDGKAIARGTDVVVLRTAGGIAFVQPWEDALLGDDSDLQPERKPDRLSLT
jgi:membrane protein implicated in regulation of membrane protease activity